MLEDEPGSGDRLARAAAARIMRTPASMTNKKSDPSRLDGAIEEMVEPAVSAAALVVVTTMRAELDRRPPTKGPRMLA